MIDWTAHLIIGPIVLPMIIASARGGFYTPGNPSAPLDHHETYVRNVFGVLGVTNISFVRAEGVGISEAVKAQSIEDALRQATESQHLAQCAR